MIGRRSTLPTGLDRFDLAILEILQRDNSTPQRTIGEAVNLSAPAVQRRIKRMEESGVITANVAIVEPSKVGQPITVLVEVELQSQRVDQIDAAKKSFAIPEIQQCYSVTGETDFILVVIVATMKDYEDLTHRLFWEDQNIKRFRTFVVVDRIRVGLSIPLAVGMPDKT